MAQRTGLIVFVFASAAAVSGLAFAADDPAPAAPAAAASPAACPPPGSKDAVAYIKNPKWIHQPSGDQVTQLYPPFAYKEHKSDRTLVDCAIAGDGHLQECSIVEDKKPGQGFDKAAIGLAKFYKTSPLAEQAAFTSLPDCIKQLGAPHVLLPMNWFAGG